jgi:HlyD family secretion protein
MEEAAVVSLPTRRPLVLGIAAVALLLALAAGAVGVKRLSTNSPATTSTTPAPPAPVQVLQVKPGPIRTMLTYSGAVQPSQQVNVSPRVAGQLVSLNAEVGTFVRAGDRLGTLDAGSLPAQLQQAQASLQSAQARLAIVLSGSRPTDVAAAQAAYDAALQN